MYETMNDSNESNTRSWFALAAVTLAALAITVAFSPAAGLYDLSPQKQIASSLR
jgi:hypothetical protein